MTYFNGLSAAHPNSLTGNQQGMHGRMATGIILFGGLDHGQQAPSPAIFIIMHQTRHGNGRQRRRIPAHRPPIDGVWPGRS